MKQQENNTNKNTPKDIPKYIPRLKDKYQKEIAKQLAQKFNYQNQYQIPKLQKIVVNMGVKDANNDSKKIKEAQNELSIITGQKPINTKAKKAIAGFKIRKGMDIGTKVTLRKNKMYEFLDRLINIALPRVQDFRGLNKKSFDQKGNFNCGIKEQIVFPEIEYDKVNLVRGMDIAICTTSNNDQEALELLKLFGMPFRK